MAVPLVSAAKLAVASKSAAHVYYALEHVILVEFALEQLHVSGHSRLEGCNIRITLQLVRPVTGAKASDTFLCLSSAGTAYTNTQNTATTAASAAAGK